MKVILIKLSLILILLFLLSGCRESLVAFSSERDGNFEICTADLDGENYTNITNSKGDDFSPDWSLDGRKIVFYSSRDRDETDEFDYNTEIYIMN